jgi:hypothetical protein
MTKHRRERGYDCAEEESHVEKEEHMGVEAMVLSDSFASVMVPARGIGGIGGAMRHEPGTGTRVSWYRHSPDEHVCPSILSFTESPVCAPMRATCIVSSLWSLAMIVEERKKEGS